MPVLRSVTALLFGIAAALGAASHPKSKAAAHRTSAPRPVASELTAAHHLSLRDAVAQLIIVRAYGDYLRSDAAEYKVLSSWIRDLHVGGLIVANRVRNGKVIHAQPFEMAAFTNHLQHLSRSPLLIGADLEHGAAMRVAGTVQYPYFMAYGAAHDLPATRALGAATAREARAVGITWVFAPDSDVNNNPDNPIINIRSYGEDPQAVAQGVAAFIDGAHQDPAHYVLLSAKHFPGHGDTAVDSHMQMPRLDQNRERLESVELVPFRAAIEHHVDSIMTAHMSVPAIEPQQIPATVSKNVLTNLLRDELGFKGLIVTDAMDMQGLAALFSQGEAAARAIEAGADVLLMPSDPAACIRGVVAAVERGRISRARIDQSVAKVLAAKQRVGLYHNRFVNLDQIADNLLDPKLEQLAQTVADESFTLVRDDKHLFPLSDPANSCLVTLTERSYSTLGEAIATGVKQRAPKSRTFAANASTPDAELDAIASDLSQCKQIYVATYVTVAEYRGSVNLEGGLAGFLTKLSSGAVPVALISLGNPYLFRSFPKVSAYAATFSTAATSENATVRALFSEIPITGKLPVSIPGLAKIGDGIQVPRRAPASSKGE